MRSTLAKTGKVEQAWYLVDGSDQVLGRLATRLATVLMGKHKPIYTPHVDTGDYVVVVNAAKVRVSPQFKTRSRTITYSTGRIGGLRQSSLAEVFEKNPVRVVELAVRRMLPKTKMGRAMLGKLKIYAGDAHEHAAQRPVPLPDWI